MTSLIETEIADGIMTVRFNRADKKNAITHEMYAALADAFRSGDTDPKVRVAIITGQGDSFTSGNDLKDFIDNPPTDTSYPVFKFMNAMSGFRKPIIGAVNGIAIGIGVTLLLHCDFIYATPDARFQLPFVSLAVVPEFGATMLLPRVVGPRKATELLLLGEPFTADQAMAWGLINEVVPVEHLLSTVNSKAKVLAMKPPGALRMAKSLMRADITEINARMDMENKSFAQQLKSPELKEAIQAFFEKRHPNFSKFE